MRVGRRRLACATVLGGLVLSCVASSPAPAAVTFPARVYAPYFETWTKGSLTSTAQDSGARYFTLAFLETLGKHSCTLAWNGSKRQTISPSGRYVSDMASLRAPPLNGDVIPSFGGWTADQAGTELADSCKNVKAIAAAYESVITTYGVTRLDMDVEGRSLTRRAGIDRRNKALKLVESWAAAAGRPFQLSYTLPTTASGLAPSGLAVLKNAVANGTHVDVVNIMVFDYYDRVTTDMGAAAISAANGLFDQLQSLYPDKTEDELWAMEGATILPGIDDYPKKTEVTYQADAQRLLDFATAHGLGTLSIWAIQRDNGGCLGTTGANRCSGIVQSPWDFTHVLAPFTG